MIADSGVVSTFQHGAQRTPRHVLGHRTDVNGVIQETSSETLLTASPHPQNPSPHAPIFFLPFILWSVKVR